MAHWTWEHDWQIPFSSAAAGADCNCGEDGGERENVLETESVGDVMEERISRRRLSRKW